MINIVNYSPEHLAKITVKDCHKTELPKSINCPALTVLLGDTPLAIFGCWFFAPGVLHAWGFVSTEVNHSPIGFYKACKKLLESHIAMFKPHRLQVDIRADYQIGCTFAESFGFEREGLMKRFGIDGMDHYLYGRAL